MALIAFYLSQALFCENAARVSTDARIIKTLHEEAARFRALADHLEQRAANENDPYTKPAKTEKHTIRNEIPGEARTGRPENKREGGEEGGSGS